MAKMTVKERLDEWKGMAENLQVQMHLGKADAEKEFEAQKKKLAEWSSKMSERVEAAKEINEENTKRVKTSLEELRVQAALGKADTEELLKQQQKELKQRMEKLRNDLDEVFETTKETSDDLLEDLSLRLHDYQVKFDIFKIQLHLAKAETEQEWEKRRKEAEQRLAKLRSDLEERTEEASERWEHFSSEMSDAWKHVRSAFS